MLVAVADELYLTLYTHAFCILYAGGGNGIEKYSSHYTENDLDTIKMIASEPSPFELIVYSLCPGIFGHELVKAGMYVCSTHHCVC
jgi:hypothetical protein